MKWESEWWGITIIAENELDDKFLEELYMRLPEKLNWPVNRPTMKKEFDKETNRLQVIFHNS